MYYIKYYSYIISHIKRFVNRFPGFFPTYIFRIHHPLCGAVSFLYKNEKKMKKLLTNLKKYVIITYREFK